VRQSDIWTYYYHKLPPEKRSLLFSDTDKEDFHLVRSLLMDNYGGKKSGNKNGKQCSLKNDHNQQTQTGTDKVCARWKCETCSKILGIEVLHCTQCVHNFVKPEQSFTEYLKHQKLHEYRKGCQSITNKSKRRECCLQSDSTDSDCKSKSEQTSKKSRNTSTINVNNYFNDKTSVRNSSSSSNNTFTVTLN